MGQAPENNKREREKFFFSFLKIIPNRRIFYSWVVIYFFKIKCTLTKVRKYLLLKLNINILKITLRPTLLFKFFLKFTISTITKTFFIFMSIPITRTIIFVIIIIFPISINCNFFILCIMW